MTEPQRGVLIQGKACLDAPMGALVQDLLFEDGWIADEPWTPLRRPSTGSRRRASNLDSPARSAKGATMDPASAPVSDPVPSTADLERVMGMLGIPGDPVYLMKDHSEARRRADLLARIAAGIVDYLARAEALAEMGVDDRADLHWDADYDVAAASSRPLDGVRLLDLQLARLTWVHHAIMRSRGTRPHQVADTVTSTIGAIIQLVQAWRDSPHSQPDEDTRRGRRTEQLDPMLADAVLMVRDATDHLAGVLRSRDRRRPIAAGIRPRVERRIQ